MDNEFYTKMGRYRVAEIKYYPRIERKIITESFGYSSVQEFCKKLHEFYVSFAENNPIWIALEFYNIRGYNKYIHFDTIFEFYSFYNGILQAGELVK